MDDEQCNEDEIWGMSWKSAATRDKFGFLHLQAGPTTRHAVLLSCRELTGYDL
jgi:hypothetical protein